MATHINSHTESRAKLGARPTALLLGAGYTARETAPALQALGYDVIGTTRSEKSAQSLHDLGITPFVTSNLQGAELKRVFETARVIISSIPPYKTPETCAAGHQHYDPVLSVLKEVTPRAAWIGYLSATSVYGDRNGQWAFEGEPASPQLKRGLARAEAELEWLETAWPVHVFRLAGIYGPGRNPFKKLKDGNARAVIKTGHVVNRIHVEDIVSAVMASIRLPSPQAIYNIADGHPAPPQDVLDYAAQLIGVAKPPRVSVEDDSVSKMAASFYSETKRIDISLAQSELDWTPKYSDYKTGLKALLSEDDYLQAS
jgi:nucleoside-diphosphate-sugar epimerase